ncbi:Uncharacterised protein [uncultured archaeon]|nr:Uncharacterised protein [uncultured archaeon]
MGRGKEKVVRCDKCGRECRKDKAVFIEKMVFSNPVDRKELVGDNGYNRGTMREMCYCPSCGKHLRVYEKKIEQLKRQKERSENREQFGSRPFNRPQGQYGQNQQAQQPQAPVVQPPENTEQPPAV